MMYHSFRLLSSPRLLVFCPLVLAALVLAADGPATTDDPNTRFRKAEALRVRAARESGDAALFIEAAHEFDAAAAAFAMHLPKQKDDLEWSFRARCAQGETLLRAHKPGEARDVLAPLLKEPALTDGPCRVAALYYHAAACVQQNDDMAAGRSLAQLAPFQDHAFGVPSRLLLARVHERADERAEALAQYEAVVDAFAERKKEAAALLQSRAAALEKDPTEKARLTALVKGPAPAAVQQAAFAAAMMHYEDGQFEKAHDLFADLAASTTGTRATDAQLYQGCCEVQLKQYARAVETLSALKPDEPLAAAQVLLWLSRAKNGAADPESADARREDLQDALETQGKALKLLNSAARLQGADGEFAQARRGELRREQAEIHERLGHYAEAADLYAQARAGGLPPHQEEEALQRELTARTLAGDPAASEKLAEQFEKTYPRSVLAPEVQLRRGENAYLLALKAAKDEAVRLNAEAARRFQLVLDQHPEFDHAQQARFSLACLIYRQGDYEKARALLEEIPTTDRKDDLAAASYLLADCLIRLAPRQTDDAVAAGKAQDQLTHAADLLTNVVAAEPYADRDSDALMRLGLCQRRLAALAAKDEDRTALEAASRAAFERVLLEYPQDDRQPHAVLERARWIKKGGDPVEASRRLQPFASGALTKHPLVPLAILHLGGYLCMQDGMAPQAARMLARTRKTYDRDHGADSAHADLAPLLRYQHALALQSAGDYAAARVILKEVMDDAGRPEAGEARLTWGLGMLTQGRNKITAADQILQNNPPDQQAEDARKDRSEGVKVVHAAADYLADQARKLGDKPPSPLLQARLYYEAAWVWRSLIDEEVASARTRLQEERKQKGDATEVALSAVPLQPAEKAARSVYEQLLAAQPDLAPLAAQARLELAELRLLRGEPPAAALALLKQALDQEPPSDVSARIGLRLADALFAGGDAVAGLRQLDRVAGLPDTSLAPAARYRAAVVVAGLGEWDKAVERLTPFRDEDPLKNVGNVSDRALLLLGQAYAELGQDEQAMQTYEQLLAAFADTGWRRHARYGEAQTLHHQKKYAEALAAYLHANASASADVAVRSQIQIGICEIELGQFAEGVETLLGAYDPDFPEMNAFALVEAAYALEHHGQHLEAEKLLHQCVENYPDSPWNPAAVQGLKSKPKVQPPHAQPEAGKLLALGPQLMDPPDPVGEPQPADGSVLEDLLDRACETAILGWPLVLRPIPSPLLRLTLPEPFENRGTVRVRSLTAIEDLPPVLPLPTPGI